MAAEDTLRDSLNTADPNRLPSACQEVKFGDLLDKLITAMTPDEAGVVPASDVATLAATPSELYQVNATAGTVTGIKKVLKGPQSVVPATGECVWTPGTALVKFAAADAVTAASFTYSEAGGTSSLLLRNIGEQDG